MQKDNEIILQCFNISKTYQLKEGFFGKKITISALKNINLSIFKNEILGLVGESGSGKSTLGRIILRLIEPDSGQIIFDNQDITKLSYSQMKPFRPKMQAIFQDPLSSLNPRMRILDLLREPLQIHTKKTTKEIDEEISFTLSQVGINFNDTFKYPHEFSGGQRQRINIARALLLKPKFIIADEPVSSLDVSIQAQILNLFMELQRTYGFSMLFISHDLRIVRHISDRIAVISSGEIVETGLTKEIFDNPKHSYTQKLIYSLPEKHFLKY
ncbi:MAG: ATP-binding cassette domain-containing protein [Proteobacteria bacterium]|nr:ATP-binding cassette domain-containing protein [Pseudomonadota bacterium]